MKNLLSSIIMLLLLGCTQASMAIDNSIYYGHWEGNAGNDRVIMNVSRKRISLTTNKTEITHPIKYEYNDSEISPYPFISITFTDKDEQEHLLYAVIGSETKAHKGYLIGFYEKSHVTPESDGVIESFS